MQNDMNGIEEYSGAYPADYCDAVIAAFERMYNQNLTMVQNSVKKNSDQRIVFDWSVGHTVYHQDFNLVQPFYEILTNIYKTHYFEKYNSLGTCLQHSAKGMSVQRTSPHQGYHSWHCEAGDKGSCSRAVAYSLYLNDVAEGGETEFLYQGVKLKPEQGKLTLFPTSYMYPHRGNPIYSGNKYIVTGWFTFDA